MKQCFSEHLGIAQMYTQNFILIYIYAFPGEIILKFYIRNQERNPCFQEVIISVLDKIPLLVETDYLNSGYIRS